mgnify:FL=1
MSQHPLVLASQLRLSRENYNLGETIVKIVESTRPLADKKGLEMTGAIFLCPKRGKDKRG